MQWPLPEALDDSGVCGEPPGDTEADLEKAIVADEAAAARPLAALEQAKLLLSGGVAGAFSKSCTAPLARLTILYQVPPPPPPPPPLPPPPPPPAASFARRLAHCGAACRCLHGVPTPCCCPRLPSLRCKACSRRRRARRCPPSARASRQRCGTWCGTRACARCGRAMA